VAYNKIHFVFKVEYHTNVLTNLWKFKVELTRRREFCGLEHGALEFGYHFNLKIFKKQSNLKDSLY
jgi:hypothetical protein